MANKKISQLPAAETNALSEDSLVAVVVGNTTCKGTLSQIKTWFGLGNAAARDVGTTTGTVAAGDDVRFGATSFNLTNAPLTLKRDTTGGQTRAAATIATEWHDANDATRTAGMVISTASSGTLTERMRIGDGISVTHADGPGAAITGINNCLHGSSYGIAALSNTSAPALLASTTQPGATPATFDNYHGGNYAPIINATQGGYAETIRAGRYSGLTNTVATIANLFHNNLTTAAAGFGARLLWRLSSATTPDLDAAAVDAVWSDAAHATRTAALKLSTVQSGGPLRERLTVGSSRALWGAAQGGEPRYRMCFEDESAWIGRDDSYPGNTVFATPFGLTLDGGNRGVFALGGFSHSGTLLSKLSNNLTAWQVSQNDDRSYSHKVTAQLYSDAPHRNYWHFLVCDGTATGQVKPLRLRGDRRVFVAAPMTEPGTTDPEGEGLGLGEISPWLDEANNLLKFRVRKSDGTYATAQVALT